MGEVHRKKISKKMIISAFLLSGILMIMTTPIHEAAHWIMSDIDPYIEPVEIHLLDFESKNKNDDILSSALGYVVVKESYPGAFNDRPFWMDLLQEIICIFIQILLTIIIVSKILTLIILRNLKKLKLLI
jgi:ABC-type sugar transport system permease subunit